MELNDQLKKRLLAAAVMIPVALLVIWVGGSLFNFMLLAVAVLMAFEWHDMLEKMPLPTNLDEPSAAKRKQFFLLVGAGYITLGIGSMIIVRGFEEGFQAVLGMCLVVWATDTAAYFVGSSLKGPKLIPQISPNKTWSGLIGGMIAAGLVNVILGFFVGTHGMVSMFFGGMSLAIIAQIGDVGESWFKRMCGVKDSGTIIPGHGGLLDRLDGLMLVAPSVVLGTFFTGGTPWS